jgi:hypothetical protein
LPLVGGPTSTWINRVSLISGGWCWLKGMRGAILHAPGDVRGEERPDPRIVVGQEPVRNYLPDPVDRVWNRRIEPGKVFDLDLPLHQVADAYQAMDERRAIKVLLRPEP